MSETKTEQPWPPLVGSVDMVGDDSRPGMQLHVFAADGDVKLTLKAGFTTTRLFLNHSQAMNLARLLRLAAFAADGKVDSNG